MASLVDCPVELLQQIYTDLGPDKAMLANVALVSKGFNLAATKMLYAEIELNFRAVEAIWTSRKLDLLLRRKASYQVYVHTITVKGGDSIREIEHLVKSLPVICKFIRLSPNLRCFRWHAPQACILPTIQLLSNSSNVQNLDMHFFGCTNKALNAEMLRQIEKDPRLKASLLQISAQSVPNVDNSLRHLNEALRKAVLQAPEVRTLVLRLCPTFQPDDNQLVPETRLSKDDSGILHSLENLKIVGPTIELRQAILGPIPHSQLRVLELWDCGDCSALFDSLSEHATELQLRVLKVIFSAKVTNTVFKSCAAFISSFTGLEELVLEGFGHNAMTCSERHYDRLIEYEMAYLAPHYRTLRRLTWLDDGSLWSVDKAMGLEQIRDICINLRSLRIRESQYRLYTGQPIPNALTKFSTLRDLTVVIDPLWPVESRLNEMRVCNTARSLISHRLKWIEITDMAHYSHEPKIFVGIKHRTDVLPRTRYVRTPVRYHIDIGTGGALHITDLLSSSRSWEEKQVFRLARALGEEYLKPEDWDHSLPRTRDSWVYGLEKTAERLQKEAIAVIEKQPRMKGGDPSPLMDTLGYRNPWAPRWAIR